jgi:hypothetical protein
VNISLFSCSLDLIEWLAFPKKNKIQKAIHQKKRQGMDLPSATTGASPQSITSNIRGNLVIK